MPRITLRTFAQLREQRGCTEEDIEVREGCTAAEAYAELFPEPRVPVGFAVNHALVKGTTVLAEGDELALIPPVGGG